MPARSMRSTRARSNDHEGQVAARHGAEQVRASGQGRDKGDVKGHGMRIECKTTSAKSFSVTLETLDKISRAAAIDGEWPVLAVRFENADGKVNREVYVILPEMLK